MSQPSAELAQTIISFLESHGATNELADIITHLQSYYDRNIRKNDVAIIKTAVPLSETEQKEIQLELQNVFNRELRLEMNLDPGIVAGLKIQVGDIVIDRTMKSKLNEIKNMLLSKQ